MFMPIIYDMSKIRAVIVEDDILTCQTLQSSLKSYNCEVVGMADNGRDAFLLAERETPDIIFMDIGLNGGQDGIDAAEEIVREFDTPIVYLTAATDDETLSRASLTRPDGYLTKPLTGGNLKAVVKITVDKHRERVGKELAGRDEINERITKHLLNHSFEQVDIGICFCDENLKASYKNKKAVELINQIDELKIKNDALFFMAREIRDYIADCIVNDIDAIFSFENDVDLLVSVSKEGEAHLKNKNVILFFIPQSDKKKNIDIMLSGLYGFTKKEVKIIRRVIALNNLRSVADDLGVKHETIRWHMKNIYSKTKADGLNSLITILTTGPARLLFKK